MARVVGRQLVEGARNAADRLATMLRSEQERIHSLAAQDVMREIRIGDFDKRISSLLASAKQSCPACVDLFVLDGSAGSWRRAIPRGSAGPRATRPEGTARERRSRARSERRREGGRCSA